MSNSQKYKPTFILIAINVAVYIFTSWAGGNFLETGPAPIYQLGQVGYLVLNEGLYYQLVTSMFVHASIVHLVGNMLFLLIFGLRGEEMFALHEFLLIYFLGGLAGNLLSLLLLDPNVPSVGASGAIFAMFGAAILYARRTARQSIIGALVYAFFLLFLSAGENVNIAAHLGGLGAGLLIGYVLSVRRKTSTRYSIAYSYGSPI